MGAASAAIPRQRATLPPDHIAHNRAPAKSDNPLTRICALSGFAAAFVLRVRFVGRARLAASRSAPEPGLGRPAPVPRAAKTYVVPCERRSRYAAQCLMACAAADPGVRAGVSDSASMPRRKPPAIQAGALRVFSARPPSTPDIAARATATGPRTVRRLQEEQKGVRVDFVVVGAASAAMLFSLVGADPVGDAVRDHPHDSIERFRMHCGVSRWAPAFAGATVRCQKRA